MINRWNSIQEAKSKDGSATDDDEPLLLASQKSKESQGWYMGNDDENS